MDFNLVEKRDYVLIEIFRDFTETQKNSFFENAEKAFALPCDRIAIDLRKITKIDSYAVGMLVKTWKSAHALGKKVYILVDPHKGMQVDDVLSELNLDAIIPIITQEEEILNPRG